MFNVGSVRDEDTRLPGLVPGSTFVLHSCSILFLFTITALYPLLCVLLSSTTICYPLSAATFMNFSAHGRLFFFPSKAFFTNAEKAFEEEMNGKSSGGVYR